jgi:Tfp pilus assembly protein PilE
MLNKKGLTIIELVVVIIILILLAVIAVWSTSNIMKKAESASIYAEFKAVYSSAIQLKNYYNAETIDDYQEGRDYCASLLDADGRRWYVVYGLNHTDDGRYNEAVIKNLGMDELKRSYQFTLDDEVVLRYYNDEYTTVAGYRVRTYEDILALQESGAI